MTSAQKVTQALSAPNVNLNMELRLPQIGSAKVSLNYPLRNSFRIITCDKDPAINILNRLLELLIRIIDYNTYVYNRYNASIDTLIPSYPI